MCRLMWFTEHPYIGHFYSVKAKWCFFRLCSRELGHGRRYLGFTQFDRLGIGHRFTSWLDLDLAHRRRKPAAHAGQSQCHR